MLTMWMRRMGWEGVTIEDEVACTNLPICGTWSMDGGLSKAVGTVII